MTELATIRRAYRYVVAYERRILDAVDRVDETAQEAGFERNTPHRWRPLYRDFPSRAWAPDQWAWNNVPIFACRYEWLRGTPNTLGNRYLLLDHIADSAFESKHLSEPLRELDPLHDLGEAQASRSLLRWNVIEVTSVFAPARWNVDWPTLLSRELGIRAADVFPREPIETIRRQSSALLVDTGCVDLESLDSPETFVQRVLDPVRRLLTRGA